MFVGNARFLRELVGYVVMRKIMLRLMKCCALSGLLHLTWFSSAVVALPLAINDPLMTWSSDAVGESSGRNDIFSFSGLIGLGTFDSHEELRVSVLEGGNPQAWESRAKAPHAVPLVELLRASVASHATTVEGGIEHADPLSAVFHNLLNIKQQSNPRAFWRETGHARHELAFDPGEEISAAVYDLRMALAQLVSEAVDLRVDEEGRRTFSLAGVDGFRLIAQGGEISLAQGDFALTVADYNGGSWGRRDASAGQGSWSAGAAGASNPIADLSRLLREMLQYPLAWVVIILAIIGQIALLVGRHWRQKQSGGALSGIREIPPDYSEHHGDRGSGDKGAPRKKMSPRSPAPQPEVEHGEVTPEVGPVPAPAPEAGKPVAEAAKPPVYVGNIPFGKLPVNPPRTGSIWLKR